MIIQLNEIRIHTVYLNLVALRAQMLDKQDAARSIAKVNYLLNASAAGSSEPHAALRQAVLLPAVAAPNDQQIANIMAGRAPDDDGQRPGPANPPVVIQPAPPAPAGNQAAQPAGAGAGVV